MRIIVICGAGASSTFVASRLRRAAKAVGLVLDACASSLAASAEMMGSADAVLVGSHVGDALDSVHAHARARGVPAAVLPADIAHDRGGTIALGIVRQLIPRIR